MRKILFLSLSLFLIANAEAKRIVLDIPDDDIAVVENDVVNAEQWIKEAWAGKLNKCRDRMIKEEIARSLEARETLPATPGGIIAKARKRSDYKNRKQRDDAMKSESKTKKK